MHSPNTEDDFDQVKIDGQLTGSWSSSPGGDLVAEAKRLSGDREDRAEMARVARLMEALRAAR